MLIETVLALPAMWDLVEVANDRLLLGTLSRTPNSERRLVSQCTETTPTAYLWTIRQSRTFRPLDRCLVKKSPFCDRFCRGVVIAVWIRPDAQSPFKTSQLFLLIYTGHGPRISKRDPLSNDSKYWLYYWGRTYPCNFRIGTICLLVAV